MTPLPKVTDEELAHWGAFAKEHFKFPATVAARIIDSLRAARTEIAVNEMEHRMTMAELDGAKEQVAELERRSGVARAREVMALRVALFIANDRLRARGDATVSINCCAPKEVRSE